MRRIQNPARRAPALLVLLSALAACATPGAAQTRLRIINGVASDGSATATWLGLLQARLSPAELDSARLIRRPLDPAERAWVNLIRARLDAWTAAVPVVALPYRPASAPDTLTIVLGNRAASDAFTHDERTIGFDLSALVREYGEAAAGDDPERIDRLFRHELAHIMQKAWLAYRPYALDTPLRLALLEIWKEGLGNHHSLSARWRPLTGGDSPATAAALAELEPRLIARLSTLACAPPSDAAGRLTADLSRGRFDRKWGALTAALWLDRELHHDPAALRDFISAGPDGVWQLAERQLPPSLAAVLREVRSAASLCASA